MWHKDCVPNEGDTELGVPVLTDKPQEKAQDSQQRIKDGQNMVECSALWGTKHETDCQKIPTKTEGENTLWNPETW